MKIAVCIKQVPDTEARLRVNKHGPGSRRRTCRSSSTRATSTRSRRRSGSARRAAAARWWSSASAPSACARRCARRSPWAPRAPCTCTIPPSRGRRGGDRARARRGGRARAVRPRPHRLAVGRPRLGRHGLAGRRSTRLAARLAGDGRRGRGRRRVGSRRARDGERQERDLPPAAAGGARGPGRHQPPALRLAQGDHGGEEEGDRDALARRPRPGRRRRSAPPARASRSSGSTSRGRATGAQILEGDAASTASQLVEQLRAEARVL